MRSLFAAFFCLLLIASAAWAQSDRGTITGTIADTSGAMIPDAPIEAKNIETGAVYQAASSDTGNYTLAQLPVGTYELSVSITGFKKYVRTGLRVSVAQTLRIDVSLELGSIAETVTVSAEAPLLKTESSELSHVVETDFMNDIPLLQINAGIRSAYASVNLIPGAQQMSVPGGIFGTLRVNGMPGGSLALRIEGQDATQQTWSAAYAMSQPNLDSVEETAIQTSNYAAEFGQAGGGLFNMTMRSGTNRLHGSAFEYMRNETMFNATQPYNHARPRDRRHDFGFAVGGPVYLPKVYDGRDKTFFFFSFEQNRLNTGVNSMTTIPTTAYRGGDFSNSVLYTGRQIGTDALGRPIMDGAIYNPLTTRTVTGTYGVWAGQSVVVRDPFMGCDNNSPNVICTDPSSPYYAPLDPVAQKLQSYLPDPTSGGATLNYHNAYQNKTVNSIYSIKMDHNLSDKLKLSGYWSMNDTFVPFPDGFPPPVTTERDLYETTHTARINIDYTMSPTMLLHLGGGIMHFVFFDPTPGFGTWDNDAELGLPGTSKGVYPTIMNIYQAQGGGMPSATGQSNGFGPIAQQKQWEQKPTGTASLSWVKGNHSYKFGAEVRVESFPSTATTPSNGWFYFSPAQTGLPYLNTTNVGDGTIGFPYASFLLGQVNNGETGIESHFHIGKHSFAFYAQDTWKITPKLTLDYGLRYDYQTYLRSDGRLPSFGYDVPNPNPQYNGLLGAAIYERNGNPDFASNYPWAFGPRLGIAYQITPKTVFRGGIGVSYSQTAYLEMWTLRFGSDVRYGPATTFGEAITQLQDGAGFTPEWPDYDGKYFPISPGANFMTSIDRHAGYPPRQLMWSVGIQREITTNMSFEISYVGNRGVWWNSPGVLTDPNRVTPDILAAHNLSIGNEADGLFLISDYNSLSAADKAAHNLTNPPYPGFKGTVSQALRPYPQFGSIFVLWAPLGNTWYDSLQMKFTKRMSYGLDLQASYTFQKELTVGTETQDTAFEVNPAIINLNDLRANKGISASSVPHRLVIAGTYQVPDWTSMVQPVRYILKDWRFGAYLVYQSGLPIMAPVALNYPNPGQMLSLCAPFSVLGGCNTSPFFNAPASYSNRVEGEPLFTLDNNSKYDPGSVFILNPDAWQTPPAASFGKGSGYYNDYRYRRAPTENLSLERIFPFREGMSLSIRVELNNAFNRTRIPSPSNMMVLPQVTDDQGHPTSGFGYINYINAGGQRTGQLVARFRF